MCMHSTPTPLTHQLNSTPTSLKPNSIQLQLYSTPIPPNPLDSNFNPIQFHSNPPHSQPSRTSFALRPSRPGTSKLAKSGPLLHFLRGGNPIISLFLVALQARLQTASYSGFPPSIGAWWKPRLALLGMPGGCSQPNPLQLQANSDSTHYTPTSTQFNSNSTHSNSFHQKTRLCMVELQPYMCRVGLQPYMNALPLQLQLNSIPIQPTPTQLN